MNKTISQSTTIPFLHSIKVKILLLCILSSISIYLLTFTVFIKNTCVSFQSNASNYMYDVCTSYSRYLDLLYTQNNHQPLSIDDLNDVLNGVGIKGIKSSYAYLVSADGTMLYHPNPDKIGLPVENSALKGFVEQLKNGQVLTDSLFQYTYKGVDKEHLEEIILPRSLV